MYIVLILDRCGSNYLLFRHVFVLYVQLEQEFDLILGRKDVVITAMHDWTYKWVPAILERADTLTGKAATLVLGAKKKYEGICSNTAMPLLHELLLLSLLYPCIL